MCPSKRKKYRAQKFALQKRLEIKVRNQEKSKRLKVVNLAKLKKESDGESEGDEEDQPSAAKHPEEEKSAKSFGAVVG